MLEANKSVIFEKIFAVYNRNLLRRRFYSFQVSGLDFLLNKSPNTPLIIYCNHSSWWDGLVVCEISYRGGLDSFIMMEEKRLRNLFLFRLLGAFSVVREKPHEALKSIFYGAELLKHNSARTLWIFPQGEILPSDLRPLKFYNGVSKIIEKVGTCATASLSMKYEFLGEFKPQIFVKIGKPEIIQVDSDFHSKSLTERLASRLTENLDSLKTDIIKRNFAGYRTIF